jgi:hypothetical protein
MSAMAMKKNKKLPGPFAALTKDARFEGTFEVFVPVEGRSKPHRVPLQFDSQSAAESWIHSPEGEDAIALILAGEV